MNDLISRQAAIDDLHDKDPSQIWDTADVEVWLNALPAEQRTGRWMTAMLDHEAFGVRPKVLYCSKCNQCIAYPTRYCPNCGAKMEV